VNLFIHVIFSAARQLHGGDLSGSSAERGGSPARTKLERVGSPARTKSCGQMPMEDDEAESISLDQFLKECNMSPKSRVHLLSITC